MPAYWLTWLHLVAAITLVGGLVFLQFVVKPALQGKNQDGQQPEVLRRIGRRFRTVAWMSLITLILTGSNQMLNESGSARIETEWGVILMLKLLVFAIAFGLLLIHDFILDPYAPVQQSAKTRSEQEHLPFSKKVTLLHNTIIALTLTVLFIAAYLTTM